MSKSITLSSTDIRNMLSFSEMQSVPRQVELVLKINDSIGDGEVFERWIADETHYLIESRGFRWNRESNCFVDNPTNPINKRYDLIRNAVLKAAVRRAIKYFENPIDDGTLRASLRPYVDTTDLARKLAYY